ncbi:MAG: ferredoxin [Paraclostridium sp.]|uniref:ferredoxin n=1 Tax=Paraclostridium TaxID=1849822 RepID=UPI001CC51291|nr:MULTISPECIES: ferredoxin [Paraclostridium]MBZ6006958.1 ferredoxin [Paraclostridium bifermentans]MDU0296999.1 ferredoxin [Paraclostridium sp. MRS3W1]
MKAFVDRDTCIGCGACEGICPDVFSIDDEGKSVPITEDITADTLDSAQDAKESCPVSAISID